MEERYEKEHQQASDANSNHFDIAMQLLNPNSVFFSEDSILKHDFLELFQSAGSNAVASLRSPLVAAARSRSSSLGSTEGATAPVNCEIQPAHELSVYSREAASLANAGHLADELDKMAEAGFNYSNPNKNEHKDDTEEQDPCGFRDLEPIGDEDEDEDQGNHHNEEDTDEQDSCGFRYLESIGDEDEEEYQDEDQGSKHNEEDTLDSTSSVVESAKTNRRRRKVYEPVVKVYSDPTDVDVLCQRGGRANIHKGNKAFLAAKDELQREYFDTPKLQRTAVSQKLVDTVHAWGGKFLRKDSNGKWFEVHNHVARTKASQALRENYTANDRAAKRAKYAAKKKKGNKWKTATN